MKHMDNCMLILYNFINRLWAAVSSINKAHEYYVTWWVHISVLKWQCYLSFFYITTPCNFSGKIIKDIQISLISNVPIKLRLFIVDFLLVVLPKIWEWAYESLITKELFKDQYISASLAFLSWNSTICDSLRKVTEILK